MKQKLDQFHIHEALHLSSVFADMIEKHLLNHPVVQQDKKLRKAVENVVDDLAGVYILIGEKSFKAK